ncbi:MAG: DNA polymerase beta superfamily protein [Myxococcota bacterium]
MSFDVGAHTIFVTLAGSQAHGTARADSDLDLRGICVMPLEQRLSLFATFEQDASPLAGPVWNSVEARVRAHTSAARALGTKTESVVFELAKFLKLCVQANPNALEILFADERDWLFETPAWLTLRAERHLFLTRRVEESFLGYAVAQLKRIRTHRAWLLAPPSEAPTREAFGLPPAATINRDDQNRLEQSIAGKLESYGIADLEMPTELRATLTHKWRELVRDVLSCSEDELSNRLRAVASSGVSIPVEVVNALNAEKRYLAAVKSWEAYRTWQRERNPQRAALEARFGYDTKHAMHLVRLLRMGLEAIEEKDLFVRRADAAELLSIRDGALSYDELLCLSTDLEGRIKEACQRSTLPTKVDEARVDALFQTLVGVIAR